jgi:hypothetical protein
MKRSPAAVLRWSRTPQPRSAGFRDFGECRPNSTAEEFWPAPLASFGQISNWKSAPCSG